MIKIGAIWLKEKDGKEYGSGRVELDAAVTLTDGLNLLFFKPREARENGPAYEVFVAKPRPKTDSPARAGATDEFPA